MSKSSFTVASSSYPSSHGPRLATRFGGSTAGHPCFPPQTQDHFMLPNAAFPQELTAGYTAFPTPYGFQPSPFGAFSEPPPYIPNPCGPLPGNGFAAMPCPMHIPPHLGAFPAVTTNIIANNTNNAPTAIGGGGSSVSVSQPTSRRRAGASATVGAISAASNAHVTKEEVTIKAKHEPSDAITASPSVQPAVIIMGPLTRSRRNRARAAAKAQQRAATAAHVDEDDEATPVVGVTPSQVKINQSDMQKINALIVDDSAFSVATSASPANTNSANSTHSASSQTSTPSVVPFIGGHVLAERLPSPVLKVRSYDSNNDDADLAITPKAADSFCEGSIHSGAEEDGVTRCSIATNVPTPSLMACDFGTSIPSSFIHAPTLQHLATSIKRSNSFPDDCSVLTAAGDSCLLNAADHDHHFGAKPLHGETDSFGLGVVDTHIPTPESEGCNKAMMDKAAKAAEKNRLRRQKQRIRKHFGRLAVGVLEEIDDEGDDVVNSKDSSPASKVSQPSSAPKKANVSAEKASSPLLPISLATTQSHSPFAITSKHLKDEEDEAAILLALHEQIAADLMGDVEADEDKEGSKGLSDSSNGSRFQTPSPPSEGDTRSITSAFAAPAWMGMLSQQVESFGTGNSFSKVISKPHNKSSAQIRNVPAYTTPLPPPPRGVILHSGQMLKNIVRPALPAGCIEGPASLRTVHIRFIPPYMSQGQLRADLLQPFGPILRVRVCANANPTEPQDVIAKFAYAFVECATPQQAAAMIATLSNLIVTPKSPSDAHSLSLHQAAGLPGLARETPLKYSIYTKGAFVNGAGPSYPAFPLHLNGNTCSMQMRLKATLSEQTIVDITPSDSQVAGDQMSATFDKTAAIPNPTQSAFGLGCLSDVTIAAAVLQHRFYKRLSSEKRAALATYSSGGAACDE